MKMNDYKIDTSYVSPFASAFGDIFTDTFEQSKYPPYNQYKDGEKTVVEIACAGFSIDELSVTCNMGVLEVSGEKKKEIEEPVVAYTHKGIATRKFSTKWNMNAEADVDVTYEDGILTIVLTPKEEHVDKIEIKSGSLKSPPQILNESMKEFIDENWHTTKPSPPVSKVIREGVEPKQS
jgi:HSP20 family molecular chaperone IbpA